MLILFCGILIVFLIPLVYIVIGARKEERARQMKLEVIRKRLAEKEKEQNSA